MNYTKELKEFRKFKRYVIWGLLKKANTLRYIHGHFFTTLKKLNQNAVWVEDEEKNSQLIKKGDLVISSGGYGNYLPLNKGTYYCLHNFDIGASEIKNTKYLLTLQIYTKGVEANTEKWGKVRYFDRKNRILYQPWGTNLLPHEFYSPVFKGNSKVVFWIGSIWDNDLHQGNEREINILKSSLRKRKLFFIHPPYGIPIRLNIFLVRKSRIAPAIGGKWQVDVGCLPCRMFKNISYGQLGISNISKFEDLLQGAVVSGKNIEELMDKALSLNKQQYIDITSAQQEYIRKYSYLDSMINIIQAFN